MDLSNVGYHINIDDLLHGNHVDMISTYGVGWFQIFLGSPRTYDFSRRLLQWLDHNSPPNLSVHSPYIINLVDRDKRVYKPSINFISDALRLCSKYKIPKFVTHLGSSDKGLEDTVMWLSVACNHVLDQSGVTDVQLLLETDAGSSSNTKHGSLELLIEFVTHYDNPQIKVCLDTEHVYAHGYDIMREWNIEPIINNIGLIHLNAIPESVELGSHIDHHSDVRLIESKNGTDYLTKIINISNNHNIPMILERAPLDIVVDDLLFIKSL